MSTRKNRKPNCYLELVKYLFDMTSKVKHIIEKKTVFIKKN